jgi:GGDEF domain-containing protein
MNRTNDYHQEDTDAEVFDAIQEMYRSDYGIPEIAPHLYEILLPKLPKLTRALVRRKLQLILNYELSIPPTKESITKRIRNAIEYVLNGNTEVFQPAETIETLDSLTVEQKAGLAPFFNMQVWRSHQEISIDGILSNDRNIITHMDARIPMVTHTIIEVAAERLPKATLKKTGCVFIDVDGMKTIVDCTSHSHGGKYLQAMAEYLSHPRGEVQQWLNTHGIKATAHSVGGDEFIVILEGAREVSPELLQEYSKLVESAIRKDDVLQSFISFDDDRFIMEYASWSAEDIEAYTNEPENFAERLRNDRALLPDRFEPSVSIGESTLYEGITEALSPHTEDAHTMEELGTNAFNCMTALADARMKANKQKFRAEMIDEKWRKFLARNNENRRLLDEIESLRQNLQELVAK